jgi:T5orf172 domain
MAVKAGFIYVLIHPSDPYLIKVGMTTRNSEIRLKEHNTQFDKAAGKVVEATGQEWVIKEFFAVEDTYNAESAFFHRSPLTEIPYALSDELIKLDDKFITWDWVNQGLKLANSAGIRKDTSQAPIPKIKPKRGAQWIEAQLKDSGLRPLKGFGNGITKVAFECSKGHVFKLDGRTLVRFPFCPVCKPERFDAYTLRRIEYY